MKSTYNRMGVPRQLTLSFTINWPFWSTSLKSIANAGTKKYGKTKTDWISHDIQKVDGNSQQRGVLREKCVFFCFCFCFWTLHLELKLVSCFWVDLTQAQILLFNISRPDLSLSLEASANFKTGPWPLIFSPFFSFSLLLLLLHELERSFQYLLATVDVTFALTGSRESRENGNSLVETILFLRAAKKWLKKAIVDGNWSFSS